mgnify:CR=1 FL=1
MMTIPAIFENVVFKPRAPVALASGATVELIVAEPQDDPVAPQHNLTLLTLDSHFREIEGLTILTW